MGRRHKVFPAKARVLAEENNDLTATGLQLSGGGRRFGRGGCRDSLGEFERYHLTRDFRETLQTGRDMDKAVGVNCHDVTRRIPAVSYRLQNPRLLGPQVAEHYVGPLDV